MELAKHQKEDKDSFMFSSGPCHFVGSLPRPGQKTAMHKKMCLGSKPKERHCLVFIMHRDFVPSRQINKSCRDKVISCSLRQSKIRRVLSQDLVTVCWSLKDNQNFGVDCEPWVAIFFQSSTSTGPKSLISAAFPVNLGALFVVNIVCLICPYLFSVFRSL